MITIDAPLAESLRNLLGIVDAAEAELAETEAKVAEARQIEERLRTRVGEIEQEMASPFIVPDADRVARLLAGENPATLDKTEVERRAKRNTLLVAEREQLRADADAVAAEAEGIAAQIGAIRRKLERARHALVKRFIELAVDRYVAEAERFMMTHVPLLRLLNAAHREVDGNSAGVIDYNLSGLSLSVWARGAQQHRQLAPWSGSAWPDGSPLEPAAPLRKLLDLARFAQPRDAG